MESNAATTLRNDTTGTSECEPLLEIAAPDVYRKNSFRVLGLAVDTSLREAAKEVNRRQMLAELGQAESGGQGRLDIRPTPTVDDLRAAEAVLHDPAQRLVHELFWFWPLDPLSSQPDPALQALKAGDLKTAATFWDSARKDAAAPAARSAVAKHNTAVRWHFHVLDIEATTEGKCWEDAQADNVRKTWVAALAYWNDSLRSDAIWNVLSARMIALDDDRVSLEFVQSMRKTAGRALLKINAMLALRYVDRNAGAALAHLGLLLDSPLLAANPSAIDEFLVAPIKESIRQRILDTEGGRTSDRSQAKDIAQRLIAKFSGYLPLLEKLTAGRDVYALAGLFDEVVSECQSCVVAYYNQTGDGPSSIAFLETLLPLARSEAVRSQVEENIATGRNNLLADKLAPLLEPLTTIEESKEAPYNRLAEFVLTIDPVVAKLGTIVSMAGPAQDIVCDRIARLLRNISVDAWNTTKDSRTAFDALGRAEKWVRSAELKTQLATDRATLVRVFAEERREQQAKKNKKYAWFTGIGVVVVFIIAVNLMDGSSPGESARPASATSSPTHAPSTYAPATDTSLTNATAPVADVASSSTRDSTRTYHVPQYITGELNRDRAAVESAQRAAADLETQLSAARIEADAKQAAARAARAELDDLGERIERARPYVSSEDAVALSRFNSDVARYNRMVKQVQQKMANSDAFVDSYNALLARAKAKAAEADRLVDAYNQKLERVGH